MSNRVLMLLRHFFNVVGWFFLATVVFSTSITVYYHFATLDPISAQIYSNFTTPVRLLTRLNLLFDGIGNAYFAFFMGSVLWMLQVRKPIMVSRTERFLIVTCGCFVARALLLSFDWAAAFPGFLSAFELFSFLFQAAINVLNPLLYAATTYVLYSHFKHMVTFESEVA